MARQRNLPASRAGRAIVKELEKITSAGHDPGRVFDDWLEMCEALLKRLPVHLQHQAQTGELAEDTPETAEMWAGLRKRYGSDPEDAWIFKQFSYAFARLWESTVLAEAISTYDDVLGEIYESWGWPNDRLGQYFTPMSVARAMARMTIEDGPQEVHARIKAAIKKSPFAEAAVLTSLAAKDDVDFDWFLSRVLPACIEYYEPLTICDPCVGSGTLLLAAAECFDPWMLHFGLVQFYGCDIDITCVHMARINLMLYGLNGYAYDLKHSLAVGPPPIAQRVKSYLDMSEPEVARQPLSPAQQEIVEAARTAAAAGHPQQVAELSQRLRQLPMFPAASADLATEPAQPKAATGRKRRRSH